jgi:hypothetical protein
LGTTSHHEKRSSRWKRRAARYRRALKVERSLEKAVNPTRKTELALERVRAPSSDESRSRDQREEERHERRRPEQLEAGVEHPLRELASRVPPRVTGELIGFAPQPAVLRNSNDQPSSGPQRRKHPAQRFVVAIDVLENVEGPNDVECSLDAEHSRIHLRQRHTFESPARHAQSFRIKLRADRI